MAHSQANQYYGHLYGATMHDLYIDSYYITDSRRSEKWYLRSYNDTLNQVVWTTKIRTAREFHSKDDATEFAANIKREFFIEEVEDWIL